MNLLALDPSLTNTGWAVYSGGILVASGCLGKVTPKQFYAKLTVLLSAHAITHTLAEDIYCGPSKATFKKLAYLQGIILAVCPNPRLKSVRVWRGQWSALTGIILPVNGKACKKILKSHFNTAKDDEAEAIAIGATG